MNFNVRERCVMLQTTNRARLTLFFDCHVNGAESMSSNSVAALLKKKIARKN